LIFIVVRLSRDYRLLGETKQDGKIMLDGSITSPSFGSTVFLKH
jgi:hypothetical protein